MTYKYQNKKNNNNKKVSKTTSFKKHKEILAWNAQISMFFVVAELNDVVLEFADVKTVTEGWSACFCCPVNYTSTTPETLVLKWWHRRPEASLKGGEPELHERVSSQKGQKGKAPGIITQQHIYAPRSSHMGWIFKNRLL